jgi:dTDP-glucose 4,6-dehydratase
MAATHTILVTGGAGFIGCHFIDLVLAREPNLRVVNLDALTYAGNLENLASLADHPRYRFVKGNICDRDLVRSLCREENFDGILNFAAESHVDRSIHNPGIFVETNVQGTLNLLQAAREAGVRRFLQVSTDEVYGALGPIGLFREDTPLAPSSPYSASKAGADMLVRAFHHTYGMDTVMTRCSNNYGPYQFPEKMIPLMINNAHHDRPLPVYGDGQQVRDWIHVRDHAAGVWQVYQQGLPGEVYNLGGECEKANLEVVRLILQLLGKPESLITYVKDRPGHDRRYAMDISKVRRELGWAPIFNFADGLKETIAWYVANTGWLERVTSGDYQKYYERHYGQT